MNIDQHEQDLDAMYLAYIKEKEILAYMDKFPITKEETEDLKRYF